MANTVIALKKSSVPTAQPTVLANGELAINYADGKLFYKHANGTILPFNTQGGNAFGTINANGTLVVAGSSEAVVSIIAGNNVTITGDAINDKITISATGGGGASVNIADNPPLSPTNGDLWWSSVYGTMFIYYNDGNSSQWVEAASGSLYANVAEQIAISAFGKANNALANSTGTFAGNLTITGTLTVGTNTVNITSNTISINGQNVSPVQSFRNKIINGNFDFWQRGTSSSTAGYLSDRWITSNVTSTFTSSRQSFTLGQTAVPNEPTYFHRTIVSSVAGVGAFCVVVQKVESVRTLASQTATLSFWAKADASKNMAVEFTQDFGTGGSPSASVTAIGVTTCALTTSWQKFTITVNIPSISGKTLGSDNNNFMQAIFWLDAGSNFNSRTNSLGQQSGTFDIAQVQLEAGSVATPFEMRPMQVELALCQRYYQKSFNIETTPAQNAGRGSAVEVAAAVASGTSIVCSVGFQVNMRVAPVITIFNPSATNSQVRNASRSADTSSTSVASDGLGQRGFSVTYTASASQAAGDTLTFHYTAAAEL